MQALPSATPAPVSDPVAPAPHRHQQQQPGQPPGALTPPSSAT
ncbi:hypothetical protein SMACR_00824 [Sordaria macrospora]|uniref:Uncharacterized protein n=1 Tax=Sordaria macrospora TaxID=5147 RepID=A0A8S8ZV58_SORMA|nr:hypothetical protein SMACR_00824 [Sordaria macrospora]WPJ61816.1 hypothetical protein SMAC4_00824 [Sordaria macrospora]